MPDNEIVTFDDEAPPSRAVALIDQSANLLTQIVSASKDPAVDAGKMQAMADLAIQLQDREYQRMFNLDLANAISEMPVITKAGRIVIADKNTGQIIQSTAFEKFEDLDRVVKPIARRNNITYSFDVGGDDKRLLVSVILRHTTTGLVERGSPMPLPLETSGSKNNVQGAGSTNTYGKRYALKNAFAISVEGADDDGNLGGPANTMPQERRNIVFAEAEAAHAAGTYDDWYKGQSAKDRQLLVATGKHAELGGGRLLPGALPAPDASRLIDQAEFTEADPDTKPKPKPKERAAPNVSTPAGWTEQYEIDCSEARTLDELQMIQRKGEKALGRLKSEGLNDLHARAVAAGSSAFERLSNGGAD